MKILILLNVCIFFFCIKTVDASWFIIQLKNGKEIPVKQYWEEDNMVRFYMEGGYVSISRNSVETITRREGDVEQIFFDDYEERFFLEEEPFVEEREVASLEDLHDDELRRDIKDRLYVTDINLQNLNRNRSIYEGRREEFVREKRAAQRTLEELSRERFVTSADLVERRGLAEKRMEAAEVRIDDIEQQIQQTDQMIASQERLKERLRDELARLGD